MRGTLHRLQLFTVDYFTLILQPLQYIPGDGENWAGVSPINNLTLPPGSGALLIRKHPHGVRSQIPLRTILQQ